MYKNVHCEDCKKKIETDEDIFIYDMEEICSSCLGKILRETSDNHNDCMPIGAWEDINGVYREHYNCSHVKDYDD